MTLFFLRRFRAYLDLERQLADAASRTILADDKTRAAIARAEIAEADKEKARDAETQSLKMVADWQAYVNGMPPIFGVARVPREEPEPGRAFPVRRQARDVADEAEREFAEEYSQLIDRQFKQQ